MKTTEYTCTVGRLKSLLGGNVLEGFVKPLFVKLTTKFSKYSCFAKNANIYYGCYTFVFRHVGINLLEAFGRDIFTKSKGRANVVVTRLKLKGHTLMKHQSYYQQVEL